MNLPEQDMITLKFPFEVSRLENAVHRRPGLVRPGLGGEPGLTRGHEGFFSGVGNDSDEEVGGGV